MASCGKCGGHLLDGCHFCPNCGAITDSSQQSQEHAALRPPEKDSRYAVIGSWSFFGTLLLLCLPVVGLILSIIWACGGAHNLNRVHFARGVLLMSLLTIVLFSAFFLFGGPASAAFGRMYFGW